MAPCRATCDHDEGAVARVLVSMFPDPGQCGLDIDELIGPAADRPESIVDREADPSVSGEVVNDRESLLPFVTDHPSSPMYVHEHGLFRIVRAIGVHVEPQSPASGAAKWDPPLLDHTPTSEWEGEQPAPRRDAVDRPLYVAFGQR